MSEIIAVTMSIDTILTREVNFLNYEYTQFIKNLGYTPLLIPNDLDYRPILEKLAVKALILSGGHDIDLNYPSKDSEKVGSTTPMRDNQEKELLDWAIERQLPVFGICRGMQLMNVQFGGDLTSDLASNHPEKINLHRRTTHDLQFAEELRGLVKNDSLIINSFHHQGINPDQLAKDFKVLAVSKDDGIIEAFYHQSLPLLAVQWHPERAGGQFDFAKMLINKYLNL